MSASSFIYDEITNFSDFFHELYDRCYSQISNAWIKTIYYRFENETFEWTKNDENVIRIYYNAYHNVVIDRDERKLYQFLENRFAISLHRRVDKTIKKIKQQRQKFIENYYERFKILFEHVEDRDKSIDQYLDYEHDFCLLKIVNWFIVDLRNIKLRSQMLDEFWIIHRQNKIIDINFQSICTTTQLKHTIMKSWRTCQTNDQSLITFQINTAIVNNINVESIKKILVFKL